jgi:hypothetical protein
LRSATRAGLAERWDLAQGRRPVMKAMMHLGHRIAATDRCCV